jgi:hypothetical protein
MNKARVLGKSSTHNSNSRCSLTSIFCLLNSETLYRESETLVFQKLVFKKLACKKLIASSVLILGALPSIAQQSAFVRREQDTVASRLSLLQDRGPSAPTWHMDNFAGRFRLFSQPNLNTPGAEWLTVTPSGFFGIGTSAPLGNFHIAADNVSAQDRPVQFVISGRTNPNLKLHLGVRTELSPPVAQISFVEEGVAWRNIALGGNGGNVGIGTLTPRERLDVNGNVRAFGAVFANAGVFDVGLRMEQERDRPRARADWDRDGDANRDRGYRDEDVILGLGRYHTRVFRVDDQGSVFAAKGFFTGGVDYAESVAVTGERAGYQPGDVMAIDEKAADGFALTRTAYSTLVAGVYSTQPGMLASTHPMEPEKFAAEVPLAMFGIVPCKVSAENGAISRGDLLVSAATPGYAMKGTDKQKMLGAIIGKALDPLPQGTGVIRVLLSSR